MTVPGQPCTTPGPGTDEYSAAANCSDAARAAVLLLGGVAASAEMLQASAVNESEFVSVLKGSCLKGNMMGNPNCISEWWLPVNVEGWCLGRLQGLEAAELLTG